MTHNFVSLQYKTLLKTLAYLQQMNDRPELFAPVFVQSEELVSILDLPVPCNQQLYSSEPSSKTAIPASHENTLGSSFSGLVSGF